LADIFAERLRAARELRKMSQSDLAEESGLLPSAVSHFETGRRSPSFANLKALADALKVTTDYLIGRSDSMEVSNAVSLKLLRHAQKMSAEDLETITRMAEVMAKKQQKKD
jgi:ribosome-binding protein aMBF1 (putative translation factor)